jgi:simple sugar transport system substrate-binding protein
LTWFNANDRVFVYEIEMEKKGGKQLNIRFITLCVGQDFFRPVKKGLRDAGALMNAECSFVGTDDVDIPTQAAMVEKAVFDGVDGIVLNLADAEAFTGVIRRAESKGIPVVAFNSDASKGKAGNIGAVCQDVYLAGKTLGAKAAEHIEAGGRILATFHSDGISALEERWKGIQESLASKKLRWKVVNTGMVPAVAADRVAAELSAEPAIRAVLCTGQADTEGAGLAVAHLPPTARPYVAGFDLSPRILQLIGEGVIHISIDQHPYLQGFLPVIQLALHIRYGIRPAFVDAGAEIIDKTKVDRVLELSRAGYR